MKGGLIILCGLAALLVIAGLASISARASQAEDDPGAVYVLTNQTANSVLVLARAADGTLSFSGNFATGGAGAGSGVDPLGSQGSLVLGVGHQRLFAVNAGSNDVSVLAVDGSNLELLDRASSGGLMPVSVAVHENLVYVVNAGGTPNIQGFFVEPSSGHLAPIPASSQALPGGTSASPGQIGISPDGASDDGALQLITGTVPDTQKANCWVAATKNNRYAYVTNTGSGTISSYLISPDGSLRLLNATAVVTGPGTAPIDFALSNDSQFLFVRLGTKGTVAGFRVESDGSLTPVGSTKGVPAGAQGVAAR